uniref:Ig-like domain-containing protein n=1 Tax=Anabas testudineus TaxID=64144 RepID=A0AAQ6IBP8_ANATE
MISWQQDNMEVTALCIKLLMIVMMLLCEHDQKVNAASLRIHPNRAQFFVYDAVTFYCEGVSYCEIVHCRIEKMPLCNKKTTETGSFTITNVFPHDSGEYWFVAHGGERSNSVIITVIASLVILEIPALPVMEGEAVTLTCRNKKTSSQTSADFYKDGVLISNSSTGNMIMNSVSKSDEGLYKCSISGAGESAESWLIVGDGQKETSSSSSTPWIIVTVLLLVLLVLVGLLQFKSYWHRVVFCVSTLRPGSGSTGSQTVSENVDSTATSKAIYAVVTKNRKKKDEDESSCRPVYYMLDLDDSQQLESCFNVEPAVSGSLARTSSHLPEDAFYSTIQ